VLGTGGIAPLRFACQGDGDHRLVRDPPLPSPGSTPPSCQNHIHLMPAVTVAEEAAGAIVLGEGGDLVADLLEAVSPAGAVGEAEIDLVPRPRSSFRVGAWGEGVPSRADPLQ
jgi:hypothetical protein